MGLRPERRDLKLRNAFAVRLRRAFREIPELSLTPVQASQLFGAPQQECERILRHGRRRPPCAEKKRWKLRPRPLVDLNLEILYPGGGGVRAVTLQAER